MIAFVPLTEAALPQVLDWRTEPSVTRYMRTDITRDPEQQLEWFRRISADSSCEHWLIRRDENNIGLAYLTDIDRASRVCSCGFYIGEIAARRFAGVILPGIVNHVFGVMKFHKIFGEVLAGNDNILKMHEMLGYRSVGVLKEHVFKQGTHHDLHLFELLRQQWEEKRDLFRPFHIPVLEPGGETP